ncbi:nucleoside triphosphate pyrophosphohydrolase [Moraxella sp. Tifton1]|uniref:nucleoside triphosphate pyrophosphohydrolase n=1 Tax=Moraxella oculi TaxID=2940516 RepID=UPI00201194A3|nr:nucleoside triphosphate pyrophosphohydrolase [Moraxella sp. Tifton1]MCL1623855.1 nucleoside triphosphate pyrophosphohydrolase [Moraxella sp. Tifton1]
MTPTDQFSDLLQLMARLRKDCPWDAKQTNQSLQKYAIEEVFELIDAISMDDGGVMADEDIKGELGDVLLQVIFHAHLYEEQGRFGMSEVIHHLQQKLIRRHPHVFDKETVRTDEEVKRRWEEIKRIENKDKPKRLLSDVKPGTALNTAQNLQSAAATVGFDWQNLGGVLQKLTEELNELTAELPNDEFDYKADKLTAEQKAKVAGELGDVLFVLANVARHLGVDGEMALQATNAKFKRRFAFVEESLISIGKSFDDVDLAQMDHYWNQAKHALDH